MKELNKNLSEIFDVNPIEEQTREVTEIIPAPKELDSEVHEDIAFARSNIKNLIRQGSSAVGNILEVARASEHPRAYEVVSTLMKTMADMNKDLLGIQKTKLELTGEKPNQDQQQTINVDKAVFVGSTTDLIKKIKEQKDGNTD
jgi:hypothetical protein